MIDHTTAVQPVLSVVIPTRNAPPSLTTTLAGLARQTLPPDRYEVLVVGGVDEEAIERCVPAGLPYSLRILVKRGPGASRRRNFGAEHARADLLVFLDDDMGPEPGLLEGHVRAHAAGSGRRVVMGYLPPPLDVSGAGGQVDWLKAELRDWWEDGFVAMTQPGHRFSYSDVLSGNLSLPTALFQEVGGFDLDYYPCRDDFELGVRLLQAGAQLHMCQDARSWHHDKTDLPRLLARKTDEGRIDVQLARQYPHLRPALLISKQYRELNISSRALRFVARSSPATADFLAGLLTPLLALCERLRLRGTWRRLLGGLLVHAYWRGVLNVTTGWDDVHDLTTAPAPSLASIDLAELEKVDGMRQVAKDLQCRKLEGVRLTWHDIPLGRLPPQAGAEPVGDRHIAAWLAEEGALPLMRARNLGKLLALSAADISEIAHDPFLLACADLQVCPQVRRKVDERQVAFRPEVVWNIDLECGRQALEPLCIPHAMLVRVRHNNQELGWLSLPAEECTRTLGRVLYALLAQLDHAAFIAR
jgi:GT2 family glycosyltransferase